MLTRIDLRHFKCFELLKLPLQPLTLLSGANASGKSSVLQALVLLHQTMREHEWSSRLMLNGATSQLGTAADIIDQLHGHRTCGISLLDGNAARYEWEFVGERDDMGMALQRARGETDEGNGWNTDKGSPLHYLLPHDSPLSSTFDALTNRLRGLAYLTAERLGPREIYPLEGPRLAPVVGSKGEHSVDVLYSGRDERVLKGLTIENAPPTRLRQVEARMARFFPFCELAIDKVPRTSAVTLGLRTSRTTEFHRPVHTGFGVTQILPIIVAALSAEEHGLLLVENPEVHLHPAGQAMMGEFLAEVAASRVQVILETHSDHVLNGVRRAVKKNILSPDNVALHFFRPRQDAERQGVAQVESPTLDINGNIDNWPDGFFDQFDKDMNHFAGWS